MKILKFGGASVGSAEKIRHIIDIVRPSLPETRVVVVSAFDKVTDAMIGASRLASSGDESYLDSIRRIETRHLDAVAELIPPAARAHIISNVKALMHELEDVLKGMFLVGECSPRTVDYVMSFGERLSAYISAEAFKVAGVEAELLDARDIIRTDRSFGAAHVLPALTEKLISAYFDAHPKLQIATGFIAATEDGETTTLGRGGSDYTAALLGAALDVSAIELWTDVDGVMTADPRHVPGALCVKALTYEEAMELSHFGAKVIYPPTIQPAYHKGIPLHIRNTFNVENDGTVISAEPVRHTHMVTGISSIDSVAFLRVQGTGMIGVAGVARRVFGVLAEKKINVILITQASSEHTICVAVLPERAHDAQRALEEEFDPEIARGLVDSILVEPELSIISAVGENMRRTTGISGKLFSALGQNGVNVTAIAQGSSELSISVVVSRRDQQKALQSIHDAFFLSEVKTAHLFLVGKGRVGSTLLRQLKEQSAALIEREALDLRLNGLAGSTRMLLNQRGIPLDDALALLERDGESFDLQRFSKRIEELNLPHSIFVDCTAGNEVPQVYAPLLAKSISIVTPNKHSVASGYEQYRNLKDLVRRRSALFLFETCVGAGLPLISTLTDLLRSGDRIHSIDAVLSGTLSFLFNSYAPGQRFSDLLAKAHELGYTEPDPRDDLSGKDVARKLLILARETGFPLTIDEVTVESLVPEECRDKGSVEDFFRELARADGTMEARVTALAAEGKRLCYIASLRDGHAKTGLEAIGPDHPFYGLAGSDNIIAFTTERYCSRPLVVKGPGAGPEVTAAGVFADIIRIAHQV